MKTAQFLKYEINPRYFEQYPIDWKQIFGCQAPLAIEIGCGNGEFLISWVQSHPDWNFVGIEMALESVARIQRRLFQYNVQNVRVIRDDARFVIRELFSDESLHYVMTNFPDPWPKDKHRHHRLMTPEFTRTLAAVLQKEGIFEIVTDQLWYAEEVQLLLKKSGFFAVAEIEENPVRSVTTKYERKWRKLGRAIYRVVVRKQQFCSINRILENTEMPHVIIEKELHPAQIFKLKDTLYKEEGLVFNIKKVYSDNHFKEFLLETVAVDSGYKQIFFILIARHPKGFIVKIDQSIQPYRTPAVKKAVFQIGKILSEN